jgi:hypothetical protein
VKSFVFIVMVWGDSDAALAGVFGTEAAALQHIRAIDSAETPAEHCHVEQWELAGDRLGILDAHVLERGSKRLISLIPRA